MTDKEQAAAAKRFAETWKERGYEKGESQSFWTSLLRDVYGVEHPEDYIRFEEKVHLDNASFIDARIPATKVLIEQKGRDKDLTRAIRQSDGSYLNPFQQAKRYVSELPLSQHPRWVITCNFRSFFVYDMEKPNGAPEEILLENLPKEYYRLQFLVDVGNEHIQKEMELSIQAGDIVGKLYDAFASQYIDMTSERSMHSLNVLCVRLVFCLYAENSGLFGHYGIFKDYLESFKTHEMRKALIDLFKILDTPEEKRDPYLRIESPSLAAFPYVNGGLFSDEDIEIPPFTDEIRDLLLEQASAGFNWSGISPTIFGAVFESTLNPETRRHGGMHYTSIENIHKVIDPLFLDDLESEFEEIRSEGVERTKFRKLTEFQNKLASLKFLDPACGSGNFLTETYLSLRRLENRVITELMRGQISVEGGGSSLIKVSIGQFYGIEINDFAVTVAKTALWIAESQTMKETEEIVLTHIDFLPLKTNSNILEGNSLRIDWESVVPKEELSYIMGNPPFVGYSLQSKEQKSDILSIFVDEKGKVYSAAGKVDYVAGWFFKAAEFMQGTNIRTALVSTNSVTQGEQVAYIWKPLFNRFGVHIDFAHRTFRWDSEASIKAHVHCVIVGFSCTLNNGQKKLYDSDRVNLVDNINAYLSAAPDVFVESRTNPICDVPQMVYGNKPTDGGFLFLTSEEYERALAEEPEIKKYIRQILGAEEFINNKKRYCLWLVDAAPEDIRKSNFIRTRVEGVYNFRINSKKEATRKSAETSTLFQEIRQPSSSYILVPCTSSERRRYVPMSFLNSNIIVSNLVQIVPDASLYEFGVLTSNVHMAWMRAVCGRLKSDYRYSKEIVYNNFPWPIHTDEQRERIEQTAQAILDARALYPDSSLADLYDDLTMPPELRKAHQENDRAVMVAYGWGPKDEEFKSESACVASLMRLYRNLT